MKFLERFQTIFLIAGIGFFILAFVCMGLAPWTTLKDLQPPEGMATRTAEEEAGRTIFMKEGCWHCHTQFVRPVAGETLRYGPVSIAAESALEIPQLFGTRRVGPDLAREAGRLRSSDWHLAHFFNPRNTVPWSVMPAFPWLYETKDGQPVPSDKARALVAYMQSLGRNVQPEMAAADQAFSKGFVAGGAPQKTEALVERGVYLFARECVGCHGVNADGDGKAAPFLQPAAANFKALRPSVEYIYTVLNKGIPGSSMPHFREYRAQDLWAIAYYLREQTPTNDVVPSGAPEKSAALVAKGATQFAALCGSCHGPNGNGDGPVGAALVPAPPNLHILRPTTARAWEVLEKGVPGTAMVPFAQLPAETRWALAYYVASLGHDEPMEKK